jgi:hypothetical protein
MIEQRVAYHYVIAPRGFYLSENIILRWEIRAVQDAHRGGV